jgi:hypothetical protein
MTSNLPSDIADSATGGTTVRENNELSLVIDDLVKLSTSPPSLENLERLAYALSVKTATILQRNIVVDATMGTTTDSKVEDQLSAISIYNNQSLAAVYLRTAAFQLRCDASSNAVAPAASSFAANNKMFDCIRMILSVSTRNH